MVWRQHGSGPMTASLWMIQLSYVGIMRIRHIRLYIQIFFKSLMIELFILKFSLLPTNLTTNCTEMMCPKCYESDETDRIALWGFEVVRSSHGADGK